jgi:hypothetical protein
VTGQRGQQEAVMTGVSREAHSGSRHEHGHRPVDRLLRRAERAGRELRLTVPTTARSCSTASTRTALPERQSARQTPDRPGKARRARLVVCLR